MMLAVALGIVGVSRRPTLLSIIISPLLLLVVVCDSVLPKCLFQCSYTRVLSTSPHLHGFSDSRCGGGGVRGRKKMNKHLCNRVLVEISVL